jgi:hypothetical protein
MKTCWLRLNSSFNNIKSDKHSKGHEWVLKWLTFSDMSHVSYVSSLLKESLNTSWLWLRKCSNQTTKSALVLLKIKDIIYIPDFDRNLISASKIVKNGGTITFNSTGMEMKN